ncbi:hypothetical protein PanWU01x14_026120 [Parasponia andersonii]|uniref:Uncharacterized protein n=1 Tax=Parasponia andersonii TaxID=3476 RepID=A0A2P5DVY3_PARAD|nr:hypothetical protein PanWU01x14_026120 [Parasponia andersonii]
MYFVDLLDPHRDAQSLDQQQPSRDGKIRDDGLDERVVNEGLDIQDHPSYANSYTYETPPIIFHEGVAGVESGDKVEQVIYDSQPLRVRKQALALISCFVEWPKKVQHSRSVPLILDPFRLPNGDDM